MTANLGPPYAAQSVPAWAGATARILAAALLSASLAFGVAHANPGSGMAGEHPRDYLHEDLDALQEAHQFVVCGLRSPAWFDDRLVTLARRAFADGMARAHRQAPVTDLAFAIHAVVAEDVGIRTSLEDCRNLGSPRRGDESVERLREVRESVALIQSGALFTAPPLPQAPVAHACLLRPPPAAVAAAPSPRPARQARRQSRPPVLSC